MHFVKLTQLAPALREARRDGELFFLQDAGAQSAGLFSKRLSRLRQGFVGQAKVRAAIKRSRLDFLKTIFFQAPKLRRLQIANAS